MKTETRAHRARRLGVALTAAASVVAGMMVGTPAMAAEGALDPTQEAAVRATMSDAGLSQATEDRLIAKLQAGQELDSEDDSATPVSTVQGTAENGDPLTTETFADGSVRTTQELFEMSRGARAPGGVSVKIYVAHPKLECNLVHCTLIYTKADTKQLATGAYATAAAIIAAACGPAAWACGIGVAGALDMAKNAHKSGRCLALQKVIALAPVYPVIVKCRS